MPAPRTLTIAWEDPRTHSWKSRPMSGMDYLRAIRDGTVKPPPAAALIGYRLVRVEEGKTIFELQPAEQHYNPFESVHGGVAAVILDTAMTSAVMTVLDERHVCSTIEMKVNFIRPITRQAKIVRSEGHLIHAGERLASAQGRVTDGTGRLLAHGTGTCMIFKRPAVE
jgi:uncharacterized protein (TIGR00369 family)